MIKIIYDPLFGYVIPDGQVEEFVLHIISTHKKESERELKVGSGVIFNRFRLALAEQKIDIHQIEFWFNDEKLEHNEYANIKDWPDGLADLDIDIAEKLLTVSMTRRLEKEKQNEHL